jgi:hypothetical protein
MGKAGLLLSTAVGLAFAVSGPSAIALGKRHAPAGSKPQSHADFAKTPFKAPRSSTPSATALKEKFLVETWAATTVAVPGGTVPLDTPQSFKCKKACTIVTNNTAELLSYYSYNQVGICPVVDGYSTNGSCNFSGTLSFDDLFANRTNQTNLSVGPGQHTVQTYLYTFAPAYLGHYQNDYHVYE